MSNTRKSGQASATEVLMIFLITAAMLLLALQIPKIINDMWTLVSLASAEAVARNLAGLITISHAAAESVTIDYAGEDKNVLYDIEVEGRLVKVNAMQISHSILLESSEPEKKSFSFSMGTAKIAVDVDASLSGLNVFRINKNRIEGHDICTMGAG
jgi:hypothetical protein